MARGQAMDFSEQESRQVLQLMRQAKRLIVDETLLADVSAKGRANFVTHYLPAASSQVLVLSTDEEIHGRYLDMIRDHVAAAFTLHYQEEQQCTVIAEGYFEEI